MAFLDIAWGPCFDGFYRSPSYSVSVHIGFGLLALPLSFLFVRWIELPALRVRGEFLKARSPAIRYAPWLAWGLNLAGVVGLIYTSRGHE